MGRSTRGRGSFGDYSERQSPWPGGPRISWEILEDFFLMVTSAACDLSWFRPQRDYRTELQFPNRVFRTSCEGWGDGRSDSLAGEGEEK